MDALTDAAGQTLRSYLEQFTPVPGDAWEAFYACFAPRELPKGAFFARPGSPATDIAFLVAGTMRAYVTDDRGAEYNKTLHVAPGFAGPYSALTTGCTNQVSVQALEPCRLLVADYRRLEGLYDRFPALERFARKLAERYFAAKEQREIALVLLDAEARYAAFRQSFPGLESRIPQYHVASYLGITPTQLSRIRAKRGK
ncbi:MAG: cAMP-binding proteins - catabolite gene activator and regulatory subunit of cAMP-dependent protein kinases [uncultured Cytophagales bacterium]|uniref:cAMP-binding proteins - catabolite gene activator and regulatory subunit of cAMP-dependent protein kinases n=1 Tax=uncultured Cytophagales bacterium TaxID=158755 RepID=A0A6J4HY33_9SPHI|nr:MAG: cAMP-binding proteins - catabolite gene activator and regulatory subunit of cAMP-dependent protein kinases [uncultured Cytophagales bacterium]